MNPKKMELLSKFYQNIGLKSKDNDEKNLEINNKKTEEEQKKIVITESMSWSELMKFAPQFSPQISDNSLGNELLDTALIKAVKNAQKSGIEVGKSDVRRHIIQAIKRDKVMQKNSTLIIKYLRGIDSDLLLECPNCGTENEFGWTYCSECGAANYN